jgi:DNA-binding GntR family transcriptional regulator
MTRGPFSQESGKSHTGRLYGRLRDDIIQGVFAPGSKLKIEDLKARYETGATPIREALSLLTADGLVERLDQRGFRVADASANEFEELLAIRCWVEERALRLAMRHGGREWEEGIVLARYRLASTPRVSPVVSHPHGGDWERAHKDFHLSLVSACGSTTLLRLCNQLYDENNRYRYIARLSNSERPDVLKEHEAIAEAVLARDADHAVRLIIDHYTLTGDLLRQSILTNLGDARQAEEKLPPMRKGERSKQKSGKPAKELEFAGVRRGRRNQ